LGRDLGLDYELDELLTGQPLRELQMDLNNNDIGINAALLGSPIPTPSSSRLAYLTPEGDLLYLPPGEDPLERQYCLGAWTATSVRCCGAIRLHPARTERMR
jgi:hypothetical protein